MRFHLSLGLGLSITTFCPAQAPQTLPQGPEQLLYPKSVQLQLLDHKPVLDQRPEPQPSQPRLSVPAGRRNHLPQPQNPETFPDMGDLEADPITNYASFEVDDGSLSRDKSRYGGSPQAAMLRDTVFAAGGIYGALSRNNGRTFQYVNPSALTTPFLPATEHRLVRPRSKDIMLWAIQTYYRGASGENEIKISVARSRDDLQVQKWDNYRIAPSMYSLPAGAVFLLADTTYTDRYIYLSVNYSQSGVAKGSYIFRFRIDQLASPSGGVSLGKLWIPKLSSPCFADGGRTAAYAACQVSTTQLRLYRWTDGSSAVAGTITVPAWTSGYATSRGPDNKDILGYDDHRFLAGYIKGDRVVFGHGANRRINRPFPYIRYAVLFHKTFKLDTTFDHFSKTRTLCYPSLTVNRYGVIAGSYCVNSPSLDPRRYIYLADGTNNHLMNPPESKQVFYSTDGPASSRWGRYQSIIEHDEERNTFLVSGQRQWGGTGNDKNEHMLVWSGRSSKTPTWVPVDVSSSPIRAVLVRALDADIKNKKSGYTPYSLSYAPQQGYRLEAPRLSSSASWKYAFERWRVNGGLRPVGENILSVSSAGRAKDTAEAIYKQVAELVIQTGNVSGVKIGITGGDFFGTTSVTSNGSAYILPNATVTLVAPGTVGGRRFYRWEINGQPYKIAQNALKIVNPGARGVYKAVYGYYTFGSLRSQGQGCLGSNGTPRQSYSTPPSIGGSSQIRLDNAPPLGLGYFILGVSASKWNGVPLPLKWPGTNCYLNVSANLLFPRSFDTTGRDRMDVPVPNNKNLLGTVLYSQYAVADALAPGQLTTSNGIRMQIGGWDIR